MRFWGLGFWGVLKIPCLVKRGVSVDVFFLAGVCVCVCRWVARCCLYVDTHTQGFIGASAQMHTYVRTCPAEHLPATYRTRSYLV